MLAEGALLQNRYRVRRQIGHGGMGAVYEAQHEELGHMVALKETFHTDNELVRKGFKREARLLAGLRHPALPRVTDYFTEGDGLFLVMEYVSGDNLESLLRSRGRPFPAVDVSGWAEQLLDALTYLHAQSPPVIHRDIKPSNVKLTSEGHIMLVDFGLAKGSVGATTSIITTHSLLGYTPNFAPLEQILKINAEVVEQLSIIDAQRVEQFVKAEMDGRSDLYSLGATLYQLLTNKLPTPAPTRALSVWSGRSDPLLTNQSMKEISTPLAEALGRALALKSEDRHPNAAAMKKALRGSGSPQAALKESGAQPDRLAPTIVDAPYNREPVPPTVAAAPTPPRPKEKERLAGAITDWKWRQVNAWGAHTSKIKSIAFSPDGKILASASWDKLIKLWDVNTRVLRLTLSGHDGLIESLAFSPTGQFLASASQMEVSPCRIWNRSAGKLERALPMRYDKVNSIAFSPDGKMLAVAHSFKITLWEVVTGNLLRTFKENDSMIYSISFSPDGKLLAAGGSLNALQFWDVQTGKLSSAIKFSYHSQRATFVRFSPDGDTVASNSSFDYSVRLWSASTGQPLKTLEGHKDVVRSLAFSPRGEVVASTSRDATIKLWGVKTGELLQTLTGSDGEIWSIAFSPDGDMLASAGDDGSIRLWRPKSDEHL